MGTGHSSGEQRIAQMRAEPTEVFASVHGTRNPQ